MKTYKFHKLSKCFPKIEGKDFAALVADIREHGCREPITLFQGKILDGANRYRACLEAGVTPSYWKLNGDDPVALVRSANLLRRHLNTGQMALIVTELEGKKPEAGRPKGETPGSVGLEDSRKAAGVSNTAARNAHNVRAEGIPELAVMVRDGEVSLDAASEVADLTKREQRVVVKQGPAGVKERASRQRKRRKKAKMPKAGDDPTACWSAAVQRCAEAASHLPLAKTFEKIDSKAKTGYRKQLRAALEKFTSVYKEIK